MFAPGCDRTNQRLRYGAVNMFRRHNDPWDKRRRAMASATAATQVQRALGHTLGRITCELAAVSGVAYRGANRGHCAAV